MIVMLCGFSMDLWCSARPMDIAYIHREIRAIGGYLPVKWMECDHEGGTSLDEDCNLWTGRRMYP